MNARRVFLVVAPAAVVAGAYLYFREGKPPTPEPVIPPAAASSIAPGPSATTRASSSELSAEGPSLLVGTLNSPQTDIKADLRLLNELFVTYRSSTHGENPVGENTDITAALMGRNSLEYAFIPSGCSAVNAKGELCDRWGTPFFFHQVSGTEMEIRSAGPDKKLWTTDDVVITP